jgi:hypothetical protein
MNAVTSRCRIHPSALQHPELIADAFALRCDNAVSCPMRHRTIYRISSDIPPLTNVADSLIALVTASNSSATLQIPIAT